MDFRYIRFFSLFTSLVLMQGCISRTDVQSIVRIEPVNGNFSLPALVAEVVQTAEEMGATCKAFSRGTECDFPKSATGVWTYISVGLDDIGGLPAVSVNSELNTILPLSESALKEAKFLPETHLKFEKWMALRFPKESGFDHIRSFGGRNLKTRFD